MASLKTIVLLFLIFTTYIVIGMIGFHFLEADNEDTVRKDTRNYKEKILKKFTCLTGEDLEALVAALSYAISNGVDPSNNATSPSNWGYSSAFFFSGTVITTIGYGHISPNTRYGRYFCIVYALIGIPICGILLSVLGDQFKKLKDKVLQNVYGQISKKWQQKAFNIFLVLGLGIFVFVVIPAAIFRAIEGWSYHEALYFCFITLTTIGFGDYVVGQNPEITYPTIYKIMVFYWVLLGLVFLATIIQDISDAITSRVENVEFDSESVKKTGNNEDLSIQNDTKYIRVNTDDENEEKNGLTVQTQNGKMNQEIPEYKKTKLPA